MFLSMKKVLMNFLRIMYEITVSSEKFLKASKSENVVVDIKRTISGVHGDLQSLLRRKNDQMDKQIEEGEGIIPEKAEDLRGNHLIPIKIEMPNKDDKPSPPDSIIEDSDFSDIRYLLIPAIAAAISLIEAFHLPSLGNYSGRNLFSVLLLINTIVFFISMASITMVMRLLPIIPWLIISVSSTIGLYICAILANFPDDIVPVLFIGGIIFLTTFHQYRPTLHIM